MRVLITLLVCSLAPTATAVAQMHGAGDAAPPPAPPALTVRSPDGRLQVTAAQATDPVRLDGALDDEVWSRAEAVGGFVQSEPQDGQPATERTEVRLAFDDTTLYIAASCFDSDPAGIVVNDIRKDFKVGDQDSFEVIIDTFLDRRNGYMFATNPEGAKLDQQVANEGRENNLSWDAVWSVRTRRTSDGWTAEMAIPFKSLRFEPARSALWGINFSRRIRRKNEVDFWAPVPRAYNLSRVSLAGNLVGLPALSPGRNLRVKPYALASSVRPVGGVFDTDPQVGLDVKYGVTAALTLDATVNPDFAQAEADEQQVNLSQFSQFFPEKRDFFLENSGIFYMGDAARNNRVNPTPTPDEDLLLFFSRRIGLTPDGRPIPIAAGGRLTGQVAGLSVGLLNVQTRESGAVDPQNYTVARIRRNFGRANDVGALFMQRANTRRAGDDNRVLGVDWNLRLFGNLDWSSYAVRTATPGRAHGQYAWRSSANWEGNFFHGKAGVMAIGEGFQSDLSFYRRTATRKWFVDTGIRPRPRALQRRGIREMHPHIVWNYYTDLDGRMIGKRLHSGYTFFFNNGGYTELSVNPEFQSITEPLRLSPRVGRVPAGDYGWTEWQLRYNTDPSRMLSAAITLITGGLWSGDQKTANVTLTARPTYKLRVSLGLQHTDAVLEQPRASFTTNLWTLRANYSFSTHMFVDSLVQYLGDREQLNANVRFNLIHRPLSDIYVVWNEQRFSTPEAPTPGRGFIVKYTHMLAF
jgi:hypothetical protein